MAYISNDSYGEITVKSCGEDWVYLSIGGAALGMKLEDAEKAHAQMGEVIDKIKARQAELQVAA